MPVAMSRHRPDSDGVEPDIVARGVEFRFVTTSSDDVVTWSFSRPQHNILIWRRGIASEKAVDFEGRPTIKAAPHTGDVWVIPADYRSTASARTADCEFTQLTLPTSILGDARLQPVLAKQDRLLHTMTDRIADLAERDDVLARLLRESIVEGLCLHIRDRFSEAIPVADDCAPELNRVQQHRIIEFLHDSPDVHVDLASLAKLVDMHVHEFRRAFTNTFRTTLYQFVLDQRIQRAKTLLTNSALSMTEISAEVGFSNPSHFSTTFKQRVGVTPTVFRRNT